MSSVTHRSICVSEITMRPFRQWLVAWPALSHYLSQCYNIVNWTLRNKIQWNLTQNSYIFIQENAFENVVWKMADILSRLQYIRPFRTSFGETQCDDCLNQYVFENIDRILFRAQCVNTLRMRQNGPHFPNDIFKCVSLYENVWISIKISLKFVPKVPINNIPALGSDNGLAPSRRQAIIWTNDG